MPQYVGPEGPEQANLAIIGEAPGRIEDILGRPFVGESGQLLDDDLQAAEMPREAVHLTNIYKYQPPGNRFEDAGRTNPPLAECLDTLHKELKEVKPNCLLLLGGNVLAAITKKRPVTRWRGSIIDTRYNIKAVVSFHPASVLRHTVRYYNRYLITRDIQRAVKESKSPNKNLPIRSISTCKSYAQLYSFLQEERRVSDLLTLDIEVIRSIPVCVGLAFRPGVAMIVPLFKSVLGYPLTKMGTRDLSQCLKLLSKTFQDKSVRITGQNFKFDQEKLDQLGLPVHGVYIDTNLAAHTLSPELPKALEFNTSIYTREPYYKEEGREFNLRTDNIENFYRYCGKDVCVENEIARKMEKELEECNLKEFFFDFVMKAYPIYYKINQTGFRIDLKKREEKRQKYVKWSIETENEIEKLSGKRINIQSPKQVAQLLYVDLKIPKRKGTGEDVLIGLLASKGVRNPEKRKILTLILLARKIRKTLSHYINAGLDADLRMRTVTKQSGTETGRSATGVLAPPVRPFKVGIALHTVTKHGDVGADIRDFFVVDPGYMFLEVDLAQAEARVVALLSEDYELLEKLKDSSFDMHRWTAGMVFNKGAKSVSKDERQMGKVVRHAGNYDIGWRMLVDTVQSDSARYGKLEVISRYKAETCLENFHDASPRIKTTFHEEVKEILRSQRKLISPQGRIREFFETLHDRTYKEGYATIPQATISDQTKQAMIDLVELDLDIKIYLEAHDSLLLGVREKELHEVARIVVNLFERPINFLACSLSRDYNLVLPAECLVSDTNWRDLKPYELDT